MTDIILFLILMALGYGFGQYTEKKHYRLLIEREKTLNQLPAIASRIPPTDIVYDQQLLIGSVVISVDYFRRFVAGLRNLFGGRVTTYEGLLDRARPGSAARRCCA